jgi:hypothetical protein
MIASMKKMMKRWLLRSGRTSLTQGPLKAKIVQGHNQIRLKTYQHGVNKWLKTNEKKRLPAVAFRKHDTR